MKKGKFLTDVYKNIENKSFTVKDAPSPNIIRAKPIGANFVAISIFNTY